MLTFVAQALGRELLSGVTFVGGCTTALHVSDAWTLQSIRFTDDVDIIVQVMSRAQWREMQSSLRQRGFYESINAQREMLIMTVTKISPRIAHQPRSAQ